MASIILRSVNRVKPTWQPLSHARSGCTLLTGDEAKVKVCFGDANVGLTYIRASVANPAKPRRKVRLRFLVDSGAMYSVVPAGVLRRLGIKPAKTRSFLLADGTEIKRSLGEALFCINGDEGTSPVIFGEEDDSILLGSVSLEVLGFMLDPFKRQLRPLPMLLAALISPRRKAGAV